MAPTNIDKSVPAQDGGAPALLAETERIAAALEPQLRQVIDTTMRRVAEVERQTLEEARKATASTEEASHDALERSSRLLDSLEVLTGSVGQVTTRLQAEFDDVTRSLRDLRGTRIDLPEELVPEPEQEPEPAPAPERVPEPAPQAESAVEETPREPDPELEPSPELTEMFRQHIIRMRDDGKSRDEAERVLKRFRHGRRFLGMLDDVYLSAAAPARKRGLLARFRSGR